MSDDTTKKSALDQLKEMNETDSISQVHFSEPELKEFDTANIFEIKTEPAETKKKFGKRSERRASQVRIRNYDEEMPDYTDKSPAPAPEPEQEVPEVQPVVEDNIISDVEIRPVQDEDLIMGKTTRLNASDLSRALETGNVQDTIVMHRPVHTDSVVVEQNIPHTQAIEAREEKPVEAIVEEEFEEDITFNLNEDKADENDDYLYDEDEDDDTDIYMDKKSISMPNYPKIEEYLADQSAQGYHFIRQDGKKFYFVQGEPRKYYYSYAYFRKEPSDEQWEKLQQNGWREITRIPGRKKKDAGWIVLRNFQEEGTTKKEIDNDEEKLRYFKKQASSYRSTMFLIFICMVCCCVTGWLQFAMYNGLWEILAACAALFVICLIIFLVYARHLRVARKRAKLLKNRIAKARKKLDSAYPHESDEELSADWNALETPEKGKKKKKKK